MNRSGFLVAISCLLISGCTAGHYNPARMEKAETIVLAEELAEIELGNGILETMIDNEINQIIKPFTAKYGKDGKLTDEQQKRLFEITRESFYKVYPKESWVEVLSIIYRKYLNNDDLKNIIDFYNSPTGIKFKSVHSQYYLDLDQAEENLVKSRMDIFVSELDKRIQAESKFSAK